MNLPPLPPDDLINALWHEGLAKLPRKIIALDDDPTGVQTVADVPVYTAWDEATLREVVHDPSPLVFVLTNSRALSSDATGALHQQLGRDLKRVAQEASVDFLLISRSDSTLRGHYPLETAALNHAMGPFDGEIIIPFFQEGGRLTLHDVHWVRDGEKLVPVGETEFARDPTFGFAASNLREWIEEKTGGVVRATQVSSLSVEQLRHLEFGEIAHTLHGVEHFGKVIVNAGDERDLRLFVCALGEAWGNGCRFVFRSAASWVRVVAGQQARPLLERRELQPGESPGLIVAGSHVAKTTRQLDALRDLPDLEWIEWHASQAQDDAQAGAEASRCALAIESAWRAGRDACLFSSREYFRVGQASGERDLAFSTRVSSGLVATVQKLSQRPGWMVAKGGITSSDIGVRALEVRRALVLGQIAPGVPVWQTGPESRFPLLPYVVFPGNVGDDDTLRQVVQTLKGKFNRR